MTHTDFYSFFLLFCVFVWLGKTKQGKVINKNSYTGNRTRTLRVKTAYPFP